MGRCRTRARWFRSVVVPLSIVLAVPAIALAAKRGMQPTDYYREAVVSDVAVSPAGDLVAFTVTTVVEKENRRHREIWLARLRSGAPDGAPFRFTDPTEDSSAPRWSPDGSILSFTSRRGKDPNDTWFARVGAPGGEAYHVEGVSAPPVWSRDGARIAFVKSPSERRDDDSSGRGKRDGWIARDARSRTLDPERFDGRVITSMHYKRDGTLDFLPDPAVREKGQLFVVAAAGGQPRQVTKTTFEVGGITWSADGGTIYFTGDEHQNDNVIGRDPSLAIYAIARDGGEPRKVTTMQGSHAQPAVSPDGTRLAFVETLKQGDQPEILVADLASGGALRGQPVNLTATWDNIPGPPSWTPDGRAVRFTAGIGGDAHVFEASLQSRSVRQVTSGPRHLAAVSLSNDGSVMAYAENDVRHPSEVFVAKADGSAEQRVTSFNDKWLADVDLVDAERLTWTVKDGTHIEGWVMKPLGYTPGRKYPMILKIHGGPYGAYGTNWFDQFQMLSASGFFVLYTNPRGSTGYGHAYQWATRGKWGEVDREDYLAASTRPSAAIPISIRAASASPAAATAGS